jgi:murein tripeptide amidase MpaA
MPDVSFDRYFRYEELTAILRAYAAEFPDLLTLESIGRSHEGRDVWLATVTSRATGPAADKPAVWVDGNIHATEVSPTTACLYFIERLTSSYSSDPAVTALLDTRAYYICPRVNPDGAEWALADRPRLIRSSTRPYPYDEEPLDGLEQLDIDGDGRMLWMRIKDPNGPWKCHPDEPRLMIRREPEETEGDFYWLFPEGLIKDYDGYRFGIQNKKEGLDLNRNFPSEWRSEYQQQGAGPYPASEPEVHNLVEFVTNHPNVTGAITFHTYSGVLLRPYGTKADEEMPAEDLWTFQKIGEKGTRLTGYPNVSVFHDFKYHPKEVTTGDFDGWCYEERGIYAWTVEIWSPQRQAGIKEYKFIDWYREHSLEEDLMMLKWSDEVLDGKGYIDWYAFEHPQLGAIELGGWDMLHCWRNPPPQFLEAEIKPFAEWLIWLGQITPRLELYALDVTPLGGDSHRITLVVQNTGWLPTSITRKAQEKKVSRGVVFEIALPDGASLQAGKLREESKQLEGRDHIPSAATPSAVSSASMDSRIKYEWVVSAPAGSAVMVSARHDRAGIIRRDVRLG